MDLQNFVAVLKRYLDQATPNYQDGDAEYLLEMLFNVYTELNGFDTFAVSRNGTTIGTNW